MHTFCLWINGTKVNDVDGIKQNFNISDVRGYYLGGMLVKWLTDRNAETEAAAVAAIPAGENPDRYLFDIFCSRYIKPKYHTSDKSKTFVHSKACSFGEKGSFSASSYNMTAGGPFGVSSYGALRAFSTSFSLSSYNIGSYNVSSFNIGSYNTGSFGFGSLNLGSSSFRPVSFGGVYSSLFGSFAGHIPAECFDAPTVNKSVIEEHDSRFFCCGSYNHFAELYATYVEEPLNRYGYGINNI